MNKLRFSSRIALFAVVALTIVIPLMAIADVPAAAKPYQRDLTRHAHAVWGLDAPVAVFAAQIHQESMWKAEARSRVGAQGLAQFMPATATWISGVYKWGDAQPTNPGWAMRALVTYDRHIWLRIQAAEGCERMGMMLSGYNGGPGWVYRDQKLAAASGYDRTRWFGHVEKVNAGRSASNWRENRGYPHNILKRWQPIYASWGGSVRCS
jgi:soluble lytic murein transglycosylase-like protein